MRTACSWRKWRRGRLCHKGRWHCCGWERVCEGQVAWSKPVEHVPGGKGMDRAAPNTKLDGNSTMNRPVHLEKQWPVYIFYIWPFICWLTTAQKGQSGPGRGISCPENFRWETHTSHGTWWLVGLYLHRWPFFLTAKGFSAPPWGVCCAPSRGPGLLMRTCSNLRPDSASFPNPEPSSSLNSSLLVKGEGQHAPVGHEYPQGLPHSRGSWASSLEPKNANQRAECIYWSNSEEVNRRLHMLILTLTTKWLNCILPWSHIFKKTENRERVSYFGIQVKEGVVFKS